MPTGTSLTAGQVRSIFALRAEGKQIKQIALTMDMSTSTVNRVLNRVTYGGVSINRQTLDAIAAHNFRTHKKRGAYKKRGHVVTGGVSLDKMNPAMPQAMKKADPAYKAANTTNMLPELKNLSSVAAALGNEPDEREPAATHEDMNLVPPKPVLTKAQALQSVLTHVSEANQARAAVKEALVVIDMLRQDAKRLEDRTFTLITELKEMGFTPAFLNLFLDECGLCTDGLPTND